ncbi:MAG: LysM peptidoglycan-binding domain-containing protein, partial [Bacillota bacterium]
MVVCPGGILYAARRGETLESVADRFDTRVVELRRSNPHIDPDRLEVGQILCIPDIASELCPEGELYTVRSGDSMFSIARRRNISTSSLIAANRWIPDPDLIYPGEQLCIPAGNPSSRQVSCPGGILYAVRRGETLTSIARK